MTRRRDVARRRGRGPARARRLLRAGLHARRQDLAAARREGRARQPRGEPRDDRRLGRVPRRRRASACCSTPSTSSTATRVDPGYALDCLRAAAAHAGAERVVLCDTNGGSLPSQIADGRWPPCARRTRRGARHPHARRLRLRGGQHARRGRGRRDAGAGHDQRDRRAHRQREPRHDHRRPPAEAGHRGARADARSRG